MTPQEKLAWLRLIRSDNVGPITFYRLIDRFGSASAALDALPDLAQRGGRMGMVKPFEKSRAEDEMAALEKCGAVLIARDEASYPPLLAEIEDAPPLLTVIGHAALLSMPSLAVVGARNASMAGRRIADDFTRKVSQAGFVITSGLARGIDTAAHMAALPYAGTVAVVAGGIDVIYPPENEKLYRAIAEQGAIVAESPFNTEPLARHFPRRNRIVSGLSLGVLIVEAAMKSGSLITARMAVEQNREVFAVPGSPLDPRAEGTNQLIADGAHMTRSADDILTELHNLTRRPLRETPAPRFCPVPSTHATIAANDSVTDKVLEILSPTPIDLDTIIRAINAPPGDVLTVILELELAGRIERQPGNKVNLI